MLDGWASAGTSLLTTEINYYEVKLGIERVEERDRRDQYRRTLGRILQSVQVVPFDREASEVAVRRQVELFKLGRPASSTDLFIAAIAASKRCEAVVTRNVKDFEGIGLTAVRPY